MYKEYWKEKRIQRSYHNANEKRIFYKMYINQFTYLLSLDIDRHDIVGL